MRQFKFDYLFESVGFVDGVGYSLLLCVLPSVDELLTPGASQLAQARHSAAPGDSGGGEPHKR